MIFIYSLSFVRDLASHFIKLPTLTYFISHHLMSGLQCMDPGTVWIFMGHDGTFLEHSTCQGQSSGPGVWRGHLYKALGKNPSFKILL